MSGHAALEPCVYRVGLAIHAREVEAVVFDLPGCACTAPTQGAVVELLPVAIAEHIAWLDQHGDVTRDAFPFGVEITESVDVGALTDVAEGEFCFQDDYRPAARQEIEMAVRRMAYARKDLLATVRHLPKAVLDWMAPSTAVRQDDWAPGVRSISGILEHIAGADGYYSRNVGAAPIPDILRAESHDLFGQRQRAIERLRALQDEDLIAYWQRRQRWQKTGFEQWTVRKGLRRLIAHERFHTKEIEQRLAWLLVGAPHLADRAMPEPVNEARP